MFPHTDHNGKKYTFSEMKTKGDVATVFWRDDYELLCTRPRFLRYNQLLKSIMADMTVQEWEAAQHMYTSFFGDGRITQMVTVKGPLGRLFHFMQTCLLLDEENLFSEWFWKNIFV